MMNTTTSVERGQRARVSSLLVRFIWSGFGGLGYDHTCNHRDGQEICRVCGSACHCGQ